MTSLEDVAVCMLLCDGAVERVVDGVVSIVCDCIFYWQIGWLVDSLIGG